MRLLRRRRRPPVNSTLGLMPHAHRTIESYVHNGRIGVLMELALETDFTARVPEFKQLARDLAIQIAAAPVTTVEELLAQTYVKDETLTVDQLIDDASRRLGERIVITRFVRWDTEAKHSPSPEPPRAPAVAVRVRKIA